MSITKVAKVAGVSHATVSRVINNNSCVSPSTTKLVREAIEKLGYKPRPLRPGPKLGSHRQEIVTQVAFLVFASPTEDPPQAFQKMLRAVSDALGQHCANMLFRICDDASLKQLVRSNRFDGILAHGQAPSSDIERKLRDVPTVWLMANRQRPSWGDQVMPDNTMIGQIAASYLIDRGHTNLAFLNLWEYPFYACEMHSQAFAYEAKAKGATVNHVAQPCDEPSTYWGRATSETTDALIDKLLALSPVPTGLFVASDLQTSIIQPALIRRGLTVGDGGDFTIISCDSEQSYLAGLYPRPATIDIRTSVVGIQAVDQLMSRINNPGDLSIRLCTTVEPTIVLPEEEPSNTPSPTQSIVDSARS